MEKKIVRKIFMGLALSTLIFGCRMQDSVEQQFKRIGMDMVHQAYESLQSKLKHTALKNTFTSNIPKWKSKLTILADSNPDSIWADDARALVIGFDRMDTSEGQKELDQFLKKYPNFKIEPWTQKYLKSFLPSNIEEIKS
jgi:lambda repressor-like predicted transcriptional regulator